MIPPFTALKAEIRDELSRIETMGGAVAAIESSYMKQALVKSNTERLNAIEFRNSPWAAFPRGDRPVATPRTAWPFTVFYRAVATDILHFPLRVLATDAGEDR